MDKIDKNLYNKEFDKMFKLDKDGAMTNIDCYVNNLEVKINILNKGIDELLKKYEAYKKMYKEMYEKTGENIYKAKMYLFKDFIQDIKKLKGE